MTLARRGRKFGLGIGISTQRIASLDVNTLAQPPAIVNSKILGAEPLDTSFRSTSIDGH